MGSGSLPKPTDLAYFIEVSNSLNLSRASERLGITQPSLTQAMVRLEDCLGVTLLHRSKKGVTLTGAGKKFLGQAQGLISHWEQVKADTLASEQDIQGLYSLGCHVSVAQYTLPQFLKRLMQKYPKLEVNLYHDLSRKIAEQVIRSELDIGIVVNPVEHLDLVIKKVTEDQVTFWTLKKPSPLQDLKSGRATLIMDPSLTQSQSLLRQIKKKGWSYSRIISSKSLEVVAKLTQAGVGVGVLPGKVVENLGGAGLLACSQAPVFKDEICVVYRTENRSNKSIEAIVKAIRAIY